MLLRSASTSPVWLLVFSLLLCGCPSAPSNSDGPASGDSTSSSTGDAAGEMPEVLLESFDPPTLEELNAKVQWESLPVLDGMKRFLDFKKENPPLVSDAEALALKNTGPEQNKKIVQSLGRPPANSEEVDWDATFNRHERMDAKSTNPILGSSVAEFDVAELTTPSLFTFDWNFVPFGNDEIIKSWEVSADRLVDKVVLRDDVTWSDGKPFTAHDVAFTFQTIMNPKVPAVAVRSGTDELRWVHAYDDHTVVFFHKESLATNTWNMLFPIIPKHIYENSIKDDPSLGQSDYHIKYEQAPVTCGPYEYASRDRGKEIVLKRRDSWYMHNGQEVRRKPYFKEVRFRIIEDSNTALLALKKGEIDEAELAPDQWVSQTDDDEFYRLNTKAMGTEWSQAYVGWNLKVPFFADKRVRQAMAYAFDHEEMLNNVCFGLYEPGQGVFHPTSWMAPKPMPTPYKQDLDKAEDLLDEAGWDDSDGDGIRDHEIDGRTVKFEFELVVASGSDTGMKIAQLLKSNLDQIGIICNVKPTEFTVMQELARTHKFQAMTAGWGTGTDPATNKNLWTTKALEQNGRNYSAYSNPKVDALFEQGEREFDRAKRAEIYGEIAKILWEDQPYMWLYYRSSFFGFNKSVRGYMFSPRNPFGYNPGFLALWKPKG